MRAISVGALRSIEIAANTLQVPAVARVAPSVLTGFVMIVVAIVAANLKRGPKVRAGLIRRPQGSQMWPIGIA